MSTVHLCCPYAAKSNGQLFHLQELGKSAAWMKTRVTRVELPIKWLKLKKIAAHNSVSSRKMSHQSPTQVLSFAPSAN